jgi:hypothetical protein
LLNEKKYFSRQKTAIKFSYAHGQRDVPQWASSCRTIASPENSQSSSSIYLRDIRPCHFWIFEDLKGKLKNRHLQGPEDIFRAFQELWDHIMFEELQIEFESSRDRLRWIIEHDREDFGHLQICKSAISWTRKNRRSFSLLFSHPVYHLNTEVGKPSKIFAVDSPPAEIPS